MARKRTKYTLRKDGRIVLSDTINGERKYFYGKTDKEVEQKRDDYIRECESTRTRRGQWPYIRGRRR
ncbi:MAG: hypothetical protein ACLTG4_02075 [Oscillospiraceae bacterium]